MGRRTVLLVVAALVAALGTTAVLLYVKNVNDRALKNASPVQVLVAKDRIPAGTSAGDAESRGLLKLQEIQRSAVPPTALSSIDTIRNFVALSDIFAGEEILSVKFGPTSAVVSLPVPAGKLGISLQLGDPQRVAGFVTPGSEVAVFLTYTPPAQPGQATPNVPTTRLLLTRVTVIAVGPTAFRPTSNPGKANTEPVPTAILTLALSQKDAEKLILGQSTGSLYFGLLTSDSQVGFSPGVDQRGLFG